MHRRSAGCSAVSALPYPVGLFGLGERIQVEDGGPRRCGAAVAPSDVRRHTPRTWALSCQKLYSCPPRKPACGIRSLASAIASASRYNVGYRRSFSSTPSVFAFSVFTQVIARLPCTSSSQRNGSELVSDLADCAASAGPANSRRTSGTARCVIANFLGAGNDCVGATSTMIQ